jgi:hypothetical protein
MLVLFIGAGFLIAIAPYHIYTLPLTEGVNTRFLVMSPTKSVLYDGEELDTEQIKDMNDEGLYNLFHFGHFELPMPLNHPLFELIPIIKIERLSPRLGASFQNGKNIELFSFMMERPFKLETVTGDQKLFILPIFKNFIGRKSNEEVWGDIFKKKLSLPSNAGRSFFESLNTLKNVSYNDLVYNLYILYNRRFLIPEATLRMSYYRDLKLGMVELPSADSRVLIEKVFILEKGIIYPLLIKTRKTDIQAMNFRKKLLQEIKFKNSTTDSAISLYAKYKQIHYGQRIDQQGMTYLFSAWSHDLENRDFVRVIILFLERGKLNLKYLKPFYEFAYKKFGSTLSSDNYYLTETSAEALKRKVKEELETEIKIESEKMLKTNGDVFTNSEEKIKFNLQKAKDKNINADEEEKSLSIE